MDVVFGIQDHLNWAQECARAVVIFAYGLTMLRLSGKRTFSKWSALDIILSIVAGSCLSRAMTGNAPFAGTLAAVAVLVVLHVVAAYASARSKTISHILEGVPVPLVRDGQLDEKARIRHLISYADLAEALRQHKLKGLEDIAKAALVQLENDGKMTVLKA